MDSSNPSRGYSGVVYTAIALCGLWSASVVAATNSVTPCNEVDRDLGILELPVESLTIDKVDHVAIESDAIDLDAIESQAELTESVAPIIFLTPRVATVLRDVFGSSEESRVPSSPLAGAEESTDANELTDDAATDSAAEDEIDLPYFQRQMFRTDI